MLKKWNKMKKVINNLSIVSALFLLSCSKSPEDPGIEYAPAMYHSRAYEPLSQVTDPKNPYFNSNPNNPYGMNMRKPVEKTIKISDYKADYYKYKNKPLFIYNLSNEKTTQVDSLKCPLPATESVIAEGKILYGRYCQHCHGENGKGDGPVGLVYKGVPSYSALADRTEGSIYHTIVYGKNRMGPHGSQIQPLDRWKIVRYVQTLQKK